MRADEFKEKFDLIQYVKENNDYVETGGGIKILCPFHLESTPSCQINEHGWHCFGACGEGGDSIDFLMKTLDKSFIEIISGSLPEKFVREHKTFKRKKDTVISPAVIANYHKRLLARPNKMQYLFDRGFDQESVNKANIGYGIPIDMYSWKFSHPRYVIPHYDEHGQLCSVKYRIDPEYEKEEQEKYISHPGVASKMYNMQCLINSQRLIYVGSQFDAAVLWYRYGIPAICPPSENTFKKEWIPNFSGKSVLIWLDNDLAGYNGALKVYENVRLVVKSASIFIYDKSFKKKDDFTDYLRRNGIDAVRKVYDNFDKDI